MTDWIDELMDEGILLKVDGKPNADKGQGLWYQHVASEAQKRAGEEKWFADPKAAYAIKMHFIFNLPKATKNTQRHIVKPDLGRLELTTLKALEHIIFPDIKQVIHVDKTKCYGKGEAALIEVIKTPGKARWPGVVD